MKRIMTQATALLAAVLLAGSVALVGTQPAAAYTNKNGVYQAQDEDESIAVTIKETLHMLGGTKSPDVGFVYDVTPVSVDGVTSSDATGAMPDLGTVQLDPSQMACLSGCTEDDGSSPMVTYYGQTSDILADAVFPHAGVYVYYITQRPTTIPELDPNHGQLAYSTRQITLTLEVANRSTGGVYVHSVVGQAEWEDVYSPGGKMDPMPRPEGCMYSCGTSPMGFHNYYVHTNGPVDPADPDPVTESTFTVSTTVTGSFINKQRYFSYIIDCNLGTFPSWDYLPAYYRGYIVQDGVVIDPVDNAAAEDIGTDATGKGYSFIKVGPYGSSSEKPTYTTFQLKHGQSLRIVDAAVGVFCTVEPRFASDSGYVTSLDLVEDGQLSYHFDKAYKMGGTVREGGTAMNYTHSRSLITPTGLTSRTAPFAGLIAVLLTATVVVVIVKARARRASLALSRAHVPVAPRSDRS
ncbi:MAG: hypothetical protein FWD75_07690 [Propionibacteriaceae bacterium]|nr:hypothetical protein [Propionibacteriaceae bacterium]